MTCRRTIRWFIWPVLMGVTMFIQQKMTPSTADPMQQKMMLFMPIMLTGMFLWAPSGLVIYWTVSNIWAIGQQMITNRLIGPPPRTRAAAGRAPDEERRRRARRRRRQGAEVMNMHDEGRATSSSDVADGDGPVARRRGRGHARQRPRRDLRRRRRSAAEAQGRGARRAAADRQHRLPPRARGRPHASSSTAWATARARTTS